MRARLVLAAAVALLAGCGGADARVTGESWYRAAVEGDAAAACALMTDTAVQSLRLKYAGEARTCEQAVDAYTGRVDRMKADTILDAGFETGQPSPRGDVGVFPAAAAYEFEILLMREVGGDWRVASVGIAPR